MKEKSYFDYLQIFRGISSLIVVLHHTYPSFQHFKGLDLPWIRFAAESGKFGVDFFFVLSGFIISYTTYKYNNNKSYLKHYLINRFVRIYVPFIPISIALLLIYQIWPQLSGVNRNISTFTSLTLLPWGNPALSVAWTLTFEIFFYLVYSINFLSRKLFFILVALWIPAIFVYNFSAFENDNSYVDLLFSYYNLEFLSGIFLSIIVVKKVKINYYIAVSGALSFLLISVMTKFSGDSSFVPNFLFVISASFFVLLSVQYWTKSIPSFNFFMLLGNSSYSLYLLHNPLQSILVRILPTSSSRFILFSEMIFVIMMCCIFSYIYYLIVEKNCIKHIKKLLL